ncbi:hypothetical protein E4U22_002913 [Claviceps purpurea]|nr:hypothetical protein E4U22_002913 [Claviceps purpurea]
MTFSSYLVRQDTRRVSGTKRIICEIDGPIAPRTAAADLTNKACQLSIPEAYDQMIRLQAATHQAR